MQGTEFPNGHGHVRKTRPLLYAESGVKMIMNVNDIITLIGSVGFPIAMCLYMTVTFNKTLETLDDRILALSTRIDTLIDKLLEK